MSDLEESEKEFERGDVLTDEEFNTCIAAFWDMRMNPNKLKRTI